MDIQTEHVLFSKSLINILDGDWSHLLARDAQLSTPAIDRRLIDAHSTTGFLQAILAVQLHGACFDELRRPLETLDVGPCDGPIT